MPKSKKYKGIYFIKKEELNKKMPRSRMIRPEFYTDAKISSISIEARYLFISMWVFADDYGVVKGNPNWLLANIYEEDNIPQEQIITYLKELETIEVIIPFKAENKLFYYIKNWNKHQKIDKPSKTRNPEFKIKTLDECLDESVVECVDECLAPEEEEEEEIEKELEEEVKKINDPGEEKKEPENNSVGILNDAYYKYAKELGFNSDKNFMFTNAAAAEAFLTNHPLLEEALRAIEFHRQQPKQYRPAAFNEVKGKVYVNYDTVRTYYLNKCDEDTTNKVVSMQSKQTKSPVATQDLNNKFYKRV